MTIFEALFRVRHDCPFIDLTSRYPSLKIYGWCNKVHEVLEVIVGSPKEYEAVLGEVEKLADVLDESPDRQEARLITSTCFCTPENSVDLNIGDLNIIEIQPTVNEGGWEYYRVIAFKHEDLATLIERLQGRGFELEMLRKTPFEGSLSSTLLSTDSIFSPLTGKQMEALTKAYVHGYYRRPRGADVKEIASRERVPRTTFQEHLSKGESKLIRSLIPYMQLYRQYPVRATSWLNPVEC